MSLDIPFALAIVILSLSIFFAFLSTTTSERIRLSKESFLEKPIFSKLFSNESKASILTKVCISYVFVSENEGRNLVNGIVEVNLSVDPTCELRLYNSSLRIFDKDKVLPYNISSIRYCKSFFVREITFSFPINLSAYQSKKIKVILSSENVSLPSYVSNYSPPSLSNVTIKVSPSNCFEVVSRKKLSEINNTEILGTFVTAEVIE